MPSMNRNWGDLGFFGYLGEQGDNMGLIVSRVTPDSPASKLGLVPRDIILTINEFEVGELSYRELQRVFTKLSSTPKIAVTMKVWNVHTKRDDTLKGELVNDAPDDE
jgi:S1-C subfamily serine protease